MIYPQKHSLTSDDKEMALLKAKAWVDAEQKRRSQQRRLSHIGTQEEYVAALKAMNLSDKKRAMLVAHKNAPERRLSAEQLAHAAGWANHSTANLHYGNLAHDIAFYIGLVATKKDRSASTYALGEYDESTSEWIMHEEVANALETLNIT
ncbi:hypothetical protein ACJ3XI_01910 [Litorimonas sp. RW-G-Af-16]|uniref:hypothetical protein n=1 Tax=Litorimonas sp. RW-G-Af-16 TaxID=3241168 RepID=UPI00390CC116